MRVTGGRRPGRSHRQRDVPCQDAYAVYQDPDGKRVAAAVADGLGSRALSHFGAQAACDAAVASLAQEPAWDEAALRRAFQAAREAIRGEAEARGAPFEHLATTLQVVALTGQQLVAGMVGDGAVVTSPPAVVLLAPVNTGYANEVVPLTADAWEEHIVVAQSELASQVLLFSDGLTRLLLKRNRGAWTPHAPFFDALLPTLTAEVFDETLAQKFLDGDAVDSSWDDDKALVVIANPPSA